LTSPLSEESTSHRPVTIPTLRMSPHSTAPPVATHVCNAPHVNVRSPTVITQGRHRLFWIKVVPGRSVWALSPPHNHRSNGYQWLQRPLIFLPEVVPPAHNCTRWGEEPLRHVVHGRMGVRRWGSTRLAASRGKSWCQLRHQHGRHPRSSDIHAPLCARSRLTPRCFIWWARHAHAREDGCARRSDGSRGIKKCALRSIPIEVYGVDRVSTVTADVLRHLPQWVHGWLESVRAPLLSTSDASTPSSSSTTPAHPAEER
jgi:hypothetical protein